MRSIVPVFVVAKIQFILLYSSLTQMRVSVQREHFIVFLCHQTMFAGSIQLQVKTIITINECEISAFTKCKFTSFWFYLHSIFLQWHIINNRITMIWYSKYIQYLYDKWRHLNISFTIFIILFRWHSHSQEVSRPFWRLRFNQVPLSQMGWVCMWIESWWRYTWILKTWYQFWQQRSIGTSSNELDSVTMLTSDMADNTWCIIIHTFEEDSKWS